MSRSSKFRLYKNHRNSIGYWDIWFEDNVIHIAHATCLLCKKVEHTEVVHEGKQSRTLKEQVISRIKSRIGKQLDKGYVRTIEEAGKPPTNTLNLSQPMLAQPFKRVRTIDWIDAYIQNKLDGHRCKITNVNGELISYSRQGKIINTIDHVLENLDVPEGVTIDGELYIHGLPLQTIASYAKRQQAGTKELVYNIFDVESDEPFGDRLEVMNNLNLDNVTSKLVTTTKVSDIDDFNISLMFMEARHAGYEGLIVRHGQKGYEAGRRSSSLVKIKGTFDDEYKVVDITPSKDGWAVLHCITPEDRVFRVSSPGTFEDKFHVLANSSEYIGRYITVEYSELTKDKIPFHPVALRWREDL